MVRAGLLGWLILTGLAASVRGDDWPQWLGPQRDGIWRETGIIEKFPESGAKVLWRTPIGGGYAGPSVVGDRVFVTDKLLPTGVTNSEDPFDRTPITGAERILCLDANTGKILWEHKYPCVYTVSYPAGPRTTPAYDDGLVYALGSEGDLRCVRADNGNLVWSKNFKQAYGMDPSPVWGFSSNPLIDGEKLIVIAGGDGTGVVAFNKKTGDTLWKAMSSEGPHGMGYSSPIIYHIGGVRQMMIFHAHGVASLNPDNGNVYWNHPFECQNGMSIITPQLSGNRLYVSAFYDGGMMLRLDENRPTSEVEWKRGGENEIDTDSLHTVFATPIFDGDTIYGTDSYGEYRAINSANGDRIWETFAPTTRERRMRWGSAFNIRHGDRTIFFSEGGDLIFAKLSRAGYEEISRAHILEPTGPAERRDVVWSHPAFAHRHVFARNDKEIICVDLAQ